MGQQEMNQNNCKYWNTKAISDIQSGSAKSEAVENNSAKQKKKAEKQAISAEVGVAREHRAVAVVYVQRADGGSECASRQNKQEALFVMLQRDGREWEEMNVPRWRDRELESW